MRPFLAASLLLLLSVAILAIPASLRTSLQEGGYILYFRHPDTDKSAGDTDVEHPLNFAAQRQLSEKGRQQARVIGECLRRYRVPVAHVYCTLYKRGQEAATLLNLGTPEPLDCLTSNYRLPAATVAARTATLRELLATPPAPGQNIVIVSHGPNLEAATQGRTAEPPEGGAWLIRPQGNDFRVLRKILADDWPTLEE